MQIEFKQLRQVNKSEIIELMNNPLVRRQMPLTSDNFSEADCDAFIAGKEQLWAEHGFGPWAFVHDGEFVGWGGLQPEEGEADLALVLHPKAWGMGKALYDEIIKRAFGEMGFESVIVLETTGAPEPGNIYLTSGGDPALGEEGYELRVSPDGVTLLAYQPAGLFRGLQTFRQLLPPAIESATLQQGPWEIGAGTIRGYPRFPWRGVMLDVVRHFFTVDQVKRYIDLIASYKMNRLHLHLSDDQGWRIMINSWPNLATYGGSTEVGGGPGGYYTQADYAEIVAYAQSHYIVVVPEIDMPGHTNAALASYAELNCDGVARPLYTGIEVGFSSLCVDKEITYAFIEDVVREIAALTPGPYFHIGGDETAATAPADFKRFIERVQPIVQAQGKQVVGWEEIVHAELLPNTIIQRWNTQAPPVAPKDGIKVLMSPASKTYMDMKYNPETALGMKWAAYIEVQDGYNWDPITQMAGVTEDEILGVEAALWAETLQTMADIEFMAFPRLPGYAEIGWSPATGRGWDEYSLRLATHGPGLTALGVNFYRSPQVPWQ